MKKIVHAQRTEPRGDSGAIGDITARSQVQQQLRESEEQYRRLIEFCPDAFLVECDGQIVFANMSAARLLGVERAEKLVGKSMKEIVHLDFWEALEQRLGDG